MTTNQTNGLNKIKSKNNNFDVRSVSISTDSGGDVIGSGTVNKSLKINDFIKVWSNGDGAKVFDIQSGNVSNVALKN